MPLVSQVWQLPEEAGKLEHLLAAYQDGHELISHITTSRLEVHKASSTVGLNPPFFPRKEKHKKK
jgi:hypothetical protein